MDDFGTFTKPGKEELHREINNAFFQVLEDNDLYLRPEKCVFEQPEMDFLGIHVKNGEISIDPSKIAGIRDYDEDLTSVSEVRKFLGTVGYQRPFIQDFAKIAKPLTELTKKATKFEWSNEARRAVQQLKEAVTTEPVLVPPDPNRQFELETDASPFATGAIIFQREPHPDDTTDPDGFPINKGKRRVIGYHSQTLSSVEQNYPIYDREYLGVMRGLRHWSYLLKNTPEKSPVLVITDHANLQYYRDPKRLPARVHSWNAERADYNMKFIYKPGAQNHADGLSRRLDHMAGLQENPDVLTFPHEMFNLDMNERQTSIATTTLGWSGVTGEEILRGQGQDVPDTIELDYQAIKTQHDNQNTLQRWQLAHGLE